MITLTALPLVLSLALWRGAPALAGRCTPGWAARSLVLLCLATALATGLVLCAVASLALAEVPAAGRIGHWSAAALADRVPVPPALGAVAGAVAVVLLTASVVHLWRTLRRIAAAGRACRALGPGVSGLVIVDDDRALAYAVPGLRGRTVVSRSLLRALDGNERRALLAHEASHLRHRHFAYSQLAELAAAANPLLRPAAAQVRRAIESWADDDAAEVVGDRLPVARALAKATLAHSSGSTSELSLAIAAPSNLGYRLRNLLEPPRRRTARSVAVMAAVAIACTGSAVSVCSYAYASFENAQSAYRIGATS